MINFKKSFDNFLEKLLGKKPEYAETPIHNEPWDGVLNLDNYMECVTVNGASNKFKKVSSFLMDIFLKHQDLDKIRVDNFDPISTTLKKQPLNVQRTMIAKLIANFNEEHTKKGKGALMVAIADDSADPETMHFKSLPKLVYLHSLANNLKVLGNDTSGVVPAESRNLANTYSRLIKEILDYDRTLLNDKIQKGRAKISLYRHPTIDTNLEMLKS